MIAWLLGLALTPIGRIVSIAVALGASFFIWLTAHDHKQRAIGAENLLKDSKIEGGKINAKNEKVRASAERPGAAERMRKNNCRDC